MGHLKSFKNLKIESGEDDGGNKKLSPPIRGHITTDSHNYKNVILPLRITKMPLWVENVGPMT